MKLLHHQLFTNAADRWARSATLLIRTPPGVKNNVAKPRVLHAALRGNLDRFLQKNEQMVRQRKLLPDSIIANHWSR